MIYGRLSLDARTSEVLATLAGRERERRGTELADGGPPSRTTVAAEWIIKLQNAIRELDDIPGPPAQNIYDYWQEVNRFWMRLSRDPDYGLKP